MATLTVPAPVSSPTPTPVGQKIASDAEAVGTALGEAVKKLAQDVVGIFRGVHL